MRRIKLVKKYANMIASQEGVQDGSFPAPDGSLINPMKLYEHAMIEAYRRMSHKDKGEFIKIIKEEIDENTGK